MGSVRKRRVKDGSIRYDVQYRDPNGAPRSKTFRKVRDADAFEATMEADKLRGQWLDPKAGRVAFKAYAEEWLSIQVVDRTTRIQMQSRLNVHVYPKLGRLLLCNIKPSTIQAWVKTLDHLAPNTRSLIFGHVKAILEAAIDDEKLSKNPCKAKSVHQPKGSTKKVIPWESPTVLAVQAALPERYQIVVETGAGLGLRQGESFGLSPDDIDDAKESVHIARQIRMIGSQLVLAPPKYGKERDVPLPVSVGKWLEDYQARFPSRLVTLPWKDLDGPPVTVRLFLTSRQARAIVKNYFNHHVWKPALRTAGVEPIRANGTHALRHFFASVLLDGGENIKALSEYLGHADPGFTLRTYTHLMKASAKRTRDAVDAVLGAVGPLDTGQVQRFAELLERQERAASLVRDVFGEIGQAVDPDPDRFDMAQLDRLPATAQVIAATALVELWRAKHQIIRPTSDMEGKNGAD